MRILKQQTIWDGFAVGASTLCLIHCLLLPVLIVLLPSLAVFLAFPETMHYWALAFAIPTSIIALLTGYRRHRSSHPMCFIAPGLVLLGVGAFFAPSELMETLITVIGALLLSVGHALNWRAVNHARTKSSKTNPPDHPIIYGG